MLDEGQPALDIELSNQDGETIQLSDFEGERIVLYFYPKAGTEGCTIKANRFSDMWENFQQRDIQVFGMSTNSVEEIAAFGENEALPFPAVER